MQPGVVQPTSQSQVISHEQPDYITGALVAVILALAGAITALWRRSERRYREELKAAKEREDQARADGEAARAREVERADVYAERVAADRQAMRETLDVILDAHKAETAAARADAAALARELQERKAAEDRTRDAKGEELVRSVLSVVDSAHRRIGRKTT